MINYKQLELHQLLALEAMRSFDCGGIVCEDCPLFTDGHICGSQ